MDGPRVGVTPMEPHPCGNTRKGVMGFSWHISCRPVQSVSLAPHSSPLGVGSCCTFISKAGLRGVRQFSHKSKWQRWDSNPHQSEYMLGFFLFVCFKGKAKTISFTTDEVSLGRSTSSG